MLNGLNYEEHLSIGTYELYEIIYKHSKRWLLQYTITPLK